MLFKYLLGYSLLITAALSWQSPAMGQRNIGGMAQRFEANSPAIGESLPDVTAYDADGNSFSLSSLKGQYSVIVFGCLT